MCYSAGADYIGDGYRKREKKTQNNPVGETRWERAVCGGVGFPRSRWGEAWSPTDCLGRLSRQGTAGGFPQDPGAPRQCESWGPFPGAQLGSPGCPAGEPCAEMKPFAGGRSKGETWGEMYPLAITLFTQPYGVTGTGLMKT